MESCARRQNRGLEVSCVGRVELDLERDRGGGRLEVEVVGG